MHVIFLCVHVYPACACTHVFCMGMYVHLFICVHTCVSHVYLCSCLCALAPVSWCLQGYMNVHSWSHPLCPLYTGSRIFLALTSTSSFLPRPCWGAALGLPTKPVPTSVGPQDCPLPAPHTHTQLRAAPFSARPPRLPQAPLPCSPWGVGSLGLCLDRGPRAPQEGLGCSQAVVVIAVERGAVAGGCEGPMAPRGGSGHVDAAGAREGRLPVWVRGRAGGSCDVREAAAEKGAPSGVSSPPPVPPRIVGLTGLRHPLC